MSQIIITIFVAALAIVALIIFLVAKSQKPKRLTPITSLAFGFVLAGIFFVDDRFIGYSLLGIGLILSVIDIFRLAKSR